MTNIVLGKVAFTWRGAFDATATYYLQDVVSYTDGSGFTNTYVCKVATAAAGAFDSTNNFELFASGTGVALNSGDLVYNNGTTIVALPIGTANQVLEVDSTTLLPTWTSIPTASSRRVKYLETYDHMQLNTVSRWAVMEDDSLVGWANNSHYFIRGGNSTTYSNPAPIAFPKGFAGVKTTTGLNGFTIPLFWHNHRYACFCVDKNSDLWVWGQYQTSVHDAKGVGASKNLYQPFNLSTYNHVDNALYGKDIVQLGHQCGQENDESQHVIDSDGRVYGCGYNGYGQLGMGNVSHDTTTGRNFFAELPFFANLKSTSNITVTQVAKTREEYCTTYFVTSDNKVYSVGYNANGALGNGTTGTGTASIPYHMNGGSLDSSNGETNGIISKVFAGPEFAFILTTDGNLSFVGRSNYGVSGLGNGSDIDITTPTITISSGNVAQVICPRYDYYSAWVLLSDGSIKSVGYNGYGKLGNGNSTQQNTWTDVLLTAADGNTSDAPVGAGETVTKIFTGNSGSYERFGVLTDAGKVYVCGYGGHGTGFGTADGTNQFLREVPCQKTITDAKFYGYNEYGGIEVLTDDGQLWAGGAGEYRMLGGEDNDDNYTLTPIKF